MAENDPEILCEAITLEERQNLDTLESDYFLHGVFAIRSNFESSPMQKEISSLAGGYAIRFDLRTVS